MMRKPAVMKCVFNDQKCIGIFKSLLAGAVEELTIYCLYYFIVITYQNFNASIGPNGY